MGHPVRCESNLVMEKKSARKKQGTETSRPFNEIVTDRPTEQPTDGQAGLLESLTFNNLNTIKNIRK